jgi:hypothetical protein
MNKAALTATRDHGAIALTNSTSRALFHNVARLCHCIRAEVVLYLLDHQTILIWLTFFGELHLNVILSLLAATHSRHVHDTKAKVVHFIKICVHLAPQWKKRLLLINVLKHFSVACPGEHNPGCKHIRETENPRQWLVLQNWTTVCLSL